MVSSLLRLSSKGICSCRSMKLRKRLLIFRALYHTYMVKINPNSKTRKKSRFTILTALATKNALSTLTNTIRIGTTSHIDRCLVLRRNQYIRMVVISMATVMEKPYAAVIASEVRKYSTTRKQPRQRIQFILGI